MFDRLAGVVHAFAKPLTARQRRDYGLEAEADGAPTTLATNGGERRIDSAPTRIPDFNTLANETTIDRQAPIAARTATTVPSQVDYRSLSQCSSSEVIAAARHAEFEGQGSWLAPLEITEQALQQPVPATRTSNLACRNMTFAKHLASLEWTGWQVAKGKVGKIPAE
jgi:hypothetical protein